MQHSIPWRRWFSRIWTPTHVSASAQEVTGGGDGQGVPPVCIGTVEGPLRAEIARTYLEQGGIVAYLQADPIAHLYGVLGPVRVLVGAGQAEEAARIFAELDFAVVLGAGDAADGWEQGEWG